MRIFPRQFFFICSSLAACLLTSSFTFAQHYTLHLKLKVIPASPVTDTFYVTGSFNDWDPSDKKYRLKKNGKFYTIDINGLKEDTYQFKFTRGSWNTVETHKNGSVLENRYLTLESDTAIECSVEEWQDNLTQEEKQHTASAHVQIIDTAFFIPQLNRTRRIWIYLPEDYGARKNRKHYPVMYMHDGQNIFDKFNSVSGEWGVDECLDSMISNGNAPVIVVGIDCSSKRMNEYNPYDFEKYGAGEGNEYVGFLVETLKPFIDKHYRTLTGKENTIIAGSSMGGLISYYAMLSHPKVFGKAGIFSPAFWSAPKIKEMTDSAGAGIEGKLFFYIGEPEGDTYVNDLKDVANRLGKISNATIYTVIDPVGRDNEQAWRKWFAEFYTWITADGFNRQVIFEK